MTHSSHSKIRFEKKKKFLKCPKTEAPHLFITLTANLKATKETFLRSSIYQKKKKKKYFYLFFFLLSRA